MTLTEFLLARIAEDEAPTFELVPHPRPSAARSGSVGHRCLICGTTEFGGTVGAVTEIAREHEDRIHQHQRVLAECAAKRRIVQEWGQFETYNGTELMQVLALPYADREGYDEAWRL